MDLQIKQEIKDIYFKLEESGYEVYLVGGCVRNLLMGIPVNDWDLATNANPELIQTVFPDSFYDNTFGTVGVKFVNNESNGKGYAEVTTFRTEREYTD